ncbi:MAG: DNA alkylation repair protein [Chloroflexi bacterium]|nr:DNA alkylation repair protein [Chloroflexota bacterium]
MNEPLKNMYNQQYVSDLATAIQREYPDFDTEAFSAHIINDDWEGRELKQRMRHITTVLHDFLPAEYRPTLDILRKASTSLGDYGFQNMVFSDYVAVYGLDDWEASVLALEQFTQQVSAEFAVRPFIVQGRDRMMAQMLQWAHHKDERVRRLATEGCRPRLPWGIALHALKSDPSPILPILEQLKHDESESVRRSVANNLNDISKDNPDVVIDVLRRWQAVDTKEIHRITSHALRTLLKSGHPNALELLGYSPDPAIVVQNLTVEPQTVPMGGSVNFSFDVESLSDAPQNLMIDFVVYLMRANGKHTPKVFKLSKRTIQPSKVLHIAKEFSFAPVTTRKYYPGEHAIEPKINGKVFERARFVLSQQEA